MAHVLNFSGFLNEHMYNTHLYFAYGSNLLLEQIKKRGVVYSKMPAKLMDYELKFNKVAKADPRKGFANVEPKQGSVVEGIVYELDNITVGLLDKMEGTPNHYEKTIVEVVLESGEKINAITYVANSKMVRDGLLPARDYINKFLVDGEKYLSPEYAAMLRAVKTLD